MRKFAVLTIIGIFVAFTVTQVFAATSFFQGFETNNAGWDVYGGQYNATRVASGTNGVISRTGSFHAEAGQYDLDTDGGSAATDWGGPEAVFPSGGYITRVDVYLNLAGGAANDTRFDWSSAISDTSANHRRDFVFNGGFYNDSDVTGTGPRFVFTASNNAGRGGAFPKNPLRDPFAVTTSGWYTLEHKFYAVAGVLKADLSIINSSGITLHTWTLSDPSDVIGVTVGGQQYGWFAAQEFPFLSLDNSRLTSINQPADKDDCKKDGWKTKTRADGSTFKNQGDCIQYVNTGK